MIELLTTTEMAEADRLAIAGGIAGIALMENAGRAVAERVAARHPPGSRVVVVAGPGNNGGDGFVAARILAERGYRVRLVLLGARERLKGDAALAAQRWTGSVETAEAAGLPPADAVVDALFGAGLDRPVEGVARALIEAMNGAPCIYAVDLPSGINGTTGAVMGVAVNATETITFFRRKPGHLLLPGRLHCGAVHVADIGIPASVLERIAPRTFANTPELWGAAFPRPRAGGHKYSRGHAVVVSGGIASTGAARLAARGALRAGAGLVTLASPRAALMVNAAASLAVMVRPVDGAPELAEFLADARRNAIVLGPGGGVGADMRALVLAALTGERAVVLDADALTSFADAPAELAGAIKRHKGATVLTPHEGEFGRLFRAMPEVHGAPSKLAARAGGGGGHRRGLPAQGLRYRDRGAGRARRHRRQRAAVARDRRLGRRAGGLHRRPAGAGHGRLRGRSRRGLAARRGRHRGGTGPDRRGSDGSRAEGLPPPVRGVTIGRRTH